MVERDVGQARSVAVCPQPPGLCAVPMSRGGGLGDTVRMWRSVLLLVCLSLPCAARDALASTLPGQPLQQRFGVEQHEGEPASHAVLGLADGRVLIANGRGVLQFDGSYWDLLELPGLSPARDIHQGPDGRLYVGGYDQFGFLEADRGGRFSYVDLRDEFGVGGEQATFGVIWELASNSRGVYFRSDEEIFFYGLAGERERWPTGPEHRRLFAAGDLLYTRIEGRGFGTLGGAGFELVAGGERFAQRPLSLVFPRPDGLLLISEEGCFLADQSGIRALPSDADEVLRQRPPSSGLQLSDGSYLLGTDVGDLIHLDAQLTLRAVHPLGPYAVLGLGRDREGGVWAASEGELVRLQLPSPWSKFGFRDGLRGAPRDTAYSQGALWVATSSGVFRSALREGEVRFELAIETALEATALLATDDGLLVADREGVLWQRGGAAARRIATIASTFDMIQSTEHPGRIFVLGETEVLVLQSTADNWTVAQRWPLDGVGNSTLIERDAQTIWIDDWRGPPQRWRIDPDSAELLERQRVDESTGLEWDRSLGSVLFELDDQLYVASGQRVFRSDGERFLPFPGAPFALFERPFDMGLAQTPYGDFAYGERQLFRRLPGTDDWQLATPGSSVARGFFDLQMDRDGKLRIKTWSGVLQFDPETAEPPLVPLAVTLGGWRLRSADGRAEELSAGPALALRMEKGDALSFDFSMPTMEPGVSFRYRIDDGSDRGWSDWSAASRPALILRSPPPGNYRLAIEGRTRSGRIGEPLALSFRVLPRWYQTTWARVLAVCAGLLLLLALAQLVARLRYRQVHAANRLLEARITERTAELESANQKLAELATEDSLTKVANRRAMEQALSREWERCGELGQPLGLIMIDVDHFKQFNDEHGHLEGDKQLIRVAQTLAGMVHPVRELLARFGGEEFAVILPGYTLEAVNERAETMRTAFDGGAFPTTVSIGIASEVPGPGRTPTHLLREADSALYRAKRQGRNRVAGPPA